MSVDRLCPADRSRVMRGIRSKNTKPERVVRQALAEAGFRYRLHRQDLPGSPDIVLPGLRVAIFVHGCFWHLHKNCRYATMPGSNAEFWREKLTANKKRDRVSTMCLAKNGWRVAIVWECVTRKTTFRREFQARFAKWLASAKGRAAFPERVR